MSGFYYYMESVSANFEYGYWVTTILIKKIKQS